MENNDGIGWRSHGTINLCPACLRGSADETEQTQRKGDLEERIRASGNTVPSGASFADVITLAVSLGLLTEVEDAPPTMSEGGAPPQGVDVGLTEARAKALTVGVPLLDNLTVDQITERIGLWALAASYEIDLQDWWTNDEAASVIRESEAAKGSHPTPEDTAEQAAKALAELMAGAMPSILEWVNKAPTAAGRNLRATQALDVERVERKRVTLIAELEKIAAGDETGAASQQPPRGRPAPIQGNLVS